MCIHAGCTFHSCSQLCICMGTQVVTNNSPIWYSWTKGTIRSRLDRSVGELYKCCSSILVGWVGRVAVSHVAEVGVMYTQTGHSSSCIECCTAGESLSLHYWAGLSMTTTHLCWCLWHHPIGMHLQAVQHSYLIYSWYYYTWIVS